VTLAAEAQRERALTSLRYHYVEGRLDDVELARRADRAVHARTTSELRAALSGLPRLAEALDGAKATARLVGYLAVLGVAWAAASLLLFVALVVLLAAGMRGAGLLAIPALWAAVSVAVAMGGRRRLQRG
jgi:hypothetical protein